VGSELIDMFVYACCALNVEDVCGFVD